MDTARIDIVIHGSCEEGYTLDDAEFYSNFELRQLISRLPKALKAVKKEQKLRRIEKRCRELEQKSRWTLRDTVFYAIHSKNIMTIEYSDHDREWTELQLMKPSKRKLYLCRNIEG